MAIVADTCSTGVEFKRRQRIPCAKRGANDFSSDCAAMLAAFSAAAQTPTTAPHDQRECPQPRRSPRSEDQHAAAFDGGVSSRARAARQTESVLQL